MLKNETRVSHSKAGKRKTFQPNDDRIDPVDPSLKLVRCVSVSIIFAFDAFLLFEAGRVSSIQGLCTHASTVELFLQLFVYAVTMCTWARHFLSQLVV